MSGSGRLFRGKKVVRRTERERQKKAVHKPETKARLRSKFEARLQEIVVVLRKYARARSAPDREKILRGALELLDACLQEKPQSHLLKLQRGICLEALQELKDDEGRAAAIECPDLLENPNAIRIAKKARIKPPPSERTSYN